MHLTNTQAEQFHKLLSQFAPDDVVSELEANQVYTYLFWQQRSPLVALSPSLVQAVPYLREIIVSQGIDNVDQLINYFQGKAAKFDEFLKALIKSNPPPFE
jgi:hypothetical protein